MFQFDTVVVEMYQKETFRGIWIVYCRSDNYVISKNMN